MLTLHIPPTTPVKVLFRDSLVAGPRPEGWGVEERVLTWVKV